MLLHERMEVGGGKGAEVFAEITFISIISYL